MNKKFNIDLDKHRKKHNDELEKIVISSVAVKKKHQIFIAASNINLSSLFRDFLDSIMIKDNDKKSS